jgi:hypothetical protein
VKNMVLGKTIYFFQKTKIVCCKRKMGFFCKKNFLLKYV